MKGNRLLFGIVVVLLTVTSVLPGCNNKEPPVEADKLVIPSSLQPYEVSEEIFPEYPPFPYGATEWEHTEDIDWPYMACVTPEQGFIEGFLQEFLAYFYIMRNGTRASDEGMALRFIVLKYQSTEFAEKSYICIGKAFELEDLTYHGIALKSGSEYVYKGEKKWWGISNPPSYLIHSGCFILYFFGRDDVTKDALDRIIVAFGVKE